MHFHELTNWPRDPTNNFLQKIFLFGTFKLVRDPIKIKFIYYGQGIAFHGEQFWGFDNDSAKNVVILGVDNSLSISCWSFGAAQRSLVLILVKSNTKCCLSLH